MANQPLLHNWPR